MIRRTLFLGILIILLGLAVTALAGPQTGQKAQDQHEIVKDVKIMGHNQRTIKALEHAIDLWHDANLKNEEKLVRQYMVQIRVIIEADLAHTQELVKDSQEEKVASNREQSGPHGSRLARVDDKHDAVDDRHDARRLRDIYQAKKRLYNSITRGASFSNRFRLLGDYVSVVERQMTEAGIELAEDIGEAIEDHRR